MPDYAAMYKRLFNSQSDAIAILMQAQKDAEEMYLSSPEPEVRLLPTADPPDKAPGDE